MFAYGFEDLTAAEWSLLEALAGRAEVTVSLPYEPGRVAFAALRTTAEDLAGLADRVEELAATLRRHRTSGDRARGARACSRTTRRTRRRSRAPCASSRAPACAARSSWSPRTCSSSCEAAPRRSGSGSSARRSSAGARRSRRPSSTLGIPYALEARLRLPQTPYGAALLALLRYAWLDGDRDALFAYLRSPYSGLAAGERRLPRRAASRSRDRGCGARRGRAGGLARRGRACGRRAASGPRAGGGPSRVLADGDARRRLRPRGAARRRGLARRPACVRGGQEPARRAGRLGRARRRDLARGRRRRARAGDGPRRRPQASRGASRSPTSRASARVASTRSTSSASRREACPDAATARRSWTTTRAAPSAAGSSAPTRPAATATSSTRRVCARRGGSPSSARRRATRAARASRARSGRKSPRSSRRRMSPAGRAGARSRRSTWPLETAPSERERLRALALLAADPAERRGGRGVARANGWERRLDRAVKAFDRRTRLRHPLVLRQLGDRALFNVTELERFADCSSAWFFDRVVDPRQSTARSTPSSAARSRTRRCTGSSPACRRRSGATASSRSARRRRSRSCVAACEQAIEGQRIEMTPMERRELTEGALARPGGCDPGRSRGRLAARPAPLRGLVRLRALAAGAAARPRAR